MNESNRIGKSEAVNSVLAPATARAAAAAPDIRTGGRTAERRQTSHRQVTKQRNGNEHDVPLPCIGSHEAVSAAAD